MRHAFWILLAIALACPLHAGDGFPIALTAHGNRLIGHVSIPPNIEADLVFTFEDPSGLSGDDLIVVATPLILPDQIFQQRLPGAVQVPEEFPLHFVVTPDLGSDLTFNGLWELEIHTENLEYEPHTPLRLFKAPDGGSFRDISLTIGQGSYRVRGSGGKFSEFVIASDLRPLRVVANSKMGDLQTSLANFQGVIDPGVFPTLVNMLIAIDNDLDAGDLDGAREKIDIFLAEVRANAGSFIPNDWEPGSGNGSVAGRLRAAARSLKLTLVHVQTPRDVGTSGVTKLFQVDGEFGNYRLRVKLTFPDQTSVDLDQLDIQAMEIDPFDNAYLDRLPVDVAIPSEFPVLLTIHPGGSEEGFRGAWDIEIDTPDLAFTADRPLRLFKAQNEGDFRDISASMGLGSYRVRGSGGKFSEFLIVEDLRPESDVTQVKYAAGQTLLATHQGLIDETLYQSLITALADSEADFDAGLFDQAIDDIDVFLDLVKNASSGELPGIWVTGEPVPNLKGLLLGGGRSIKMQLVLADAPLSTCDPYDINGDNVVDVQDVYQLIEIVFPSGPPPSLEGIGSSTERPKEK